MKDLIENRQIRVFISSTFEDMQDERDYLMKRTFPKLRKLAAERDVTLTELDLRWGITEEEAKTGKVVEICLREIENSIPFFIGIIGNRYGWVPENKDVSANVTERFPDVNSYLERHLSVTEMEMQFGVLQRKENMHAYFFIKEQKQASDNIEMLERLISEVKESRYPCTTYSSVEDLSLQVEEAFIALLEELFPIDGITIFDKERLYQSSTINQFKQVYVEFGDYFEKLTIFVSDPKDNYLSIISDSGTGKSALLANWIDDSMGKIDAYWLYYFTNCNGDITPESVLQYWINELERLQNRSLTIFDKSLRKEQLTKFLEDLLNLSPKPVILLLDSAFVFEQSDNWTINTFSWIPPVSGKNKLIMTSNSGTNCLTQHRLEQEGATEKVIQLSLLPKETIERLTEQYLYKLYGKKLGKEQLGKIAEFKLASNAGVLITLLDELVNYGSFETLDCFLDSYLDTETIGIFYEKFLIHIENYFGAELVKRALALLTLSYYGLKETEIRDCLAVKPIAWSQLYYVLVKFTSTQNGCIRITNDHVVEAIWEKYHEDEINNRQFLVQFLENQIQKDAGGVSDYRLYDELLWQCYYLSKDEVSEYSDKLYRLIAFPDVFWYLYTKRASKMVTFDGEGKQIYKYWTLLHSIDPQRYSLVIYLDEGKLTEEELVRKACGFVDVAIHADDMPAVVFILTKALQAYRRGVIVEGEDKDLFCSSISWLSNVAREWDLRSLYDFAQKEITENIIPSEETVTERTLFLLSQAETTEDVAKALELYHQVLDCLSQINSEPDLDKAMVYYRIANCHSTNFEYEEALHYADLAIQDMEVVTCGDYDDHNETFIAYLYGFKTLILKSSKQYEKALEACEKAISRYEDLEDKRIEHGNYIATIDEVEEWSQEYVEIECLMNSN